MTIQERVKETLELHKIDMSKEMSALDKSGDTFVPPVQENAKEHYDKEDLI
jgi:hypothetical protein